SMLHWEIMQLRLVLGLIVLLGAGAFVAMAHEVLTPAAALDSGPRLVDIPAHDSVVDIARRLHSAGVIRSRAGFVLLAFARGSARQLKAGEYEFARGRSTLDVLTQIEAGRVKQHLVLHPEGATVTELARVLESEGLATVAAVTRAASDPALLATLMVEGPSVEGYLFPDTYQLVRGMTADEILTRMVQRFRAKVGPDLASRAQARGLTVHQLLTLASILEREAVARDEMRTISAVFWNRLKLNMPLQADPTVQYATGKGGPALPRADLATEHAFNTYRHVGLPPGPIASPGLAAIEAALDPATVKHLYFFAVGAPRPP